MSATDCSIKSRPNSWQPLLPAVASLNSYDEVRSYLQQMLARGDHSVEGVVSQIKGQLGELVFKDQAGGHAYLATSTNQEAWDVAIPHAHEATQYIQVKIYHSAGAVIDKMQEVNQAVAEKTITDGGNAVHHIDFAINQDIVGEVLRKQAQHPELAGIKVYAIPISNTDATGVVVDGFKNVGPDEIVHLFDEWFAGSISAACLHGMANAFLVLQGQQDSRGSYRSHCDQYRSFCTRHRSRSTRCLAGHQH